MGATIKRMGPGWAEAFARMRHADEREPSGAPLLAHVGRVVGRVPPEASVVAWLHEVLESTSVSEQELLMEGLTDDELRALRLLRRVGGSRSDVAYLAHIEGIAQAAGRSGELARTVKLADLADRCAHPRVRRDGWTPPYAEALQRLLDLESDPGVPA